MLNFHFSNKNPLKYLLFFSLALNVQACSADNSSSEAKLLNSARNNMVFIEGGSFTMGQVLLNGKLTQAYSPHKVTLSSFYMSKDNVSFGDYDTYTELTGQPYIEKAFKDNNVFFRQANYPVNQATWYQAHDYCAWLAKKTGLAYSLPTEAQWEYAARNRGNSKWAFPTNNGKQELGVNFPNYQQLTSQPGNTLQTQNALPIGSIPCTPNGLCGMTGAVNEWVNDWYEPNYYQNSPVNNPQGPATGSLKVLRGAAAGQDPSVSNTFGRNGDDPNDQNGGFRCVINTSTSPNHLNAFASGYPK